MKKNYNVSIDDNGSSFLVVINNTFERFVVGGFNTRGGAWKHIKWVYQIESQEFTVGKKGISVTEWIDGMKKAGYLD